MNSRKPGLDVIRVVAILWVMVHHAILPSSSGLLRAIGRNGYLGVDLFFVLSGWLIGGQLLKQFKSGSFELVRFWNRRWLRTLPAYLAVLPLAVVVFGAGRNVPAFLLFVQNYTAPEAWNITWSLCVEEHFYLLLPLALLVAVRFPRVGLAGLGLGIISGPVLRAIAFVPWFGASPNFAAWYARTHTRLDGLLLGVGMAAIATYAPAAWATLTRYRWTLAAVGTLLLVSCAHAGYLYTSRSIASWIFFGASLGTAMLLPAAATLRWKAPKILATASDHAYTLYLTHYFVLAAVGAFTPGTRIPAFFILSAIAAWILRTSIEKPFLTLRDRSPRPARAALELRSAT